MCNQRFGDQGHEFTGHVVELGEGVKDFKIGDRVVAPFTTSWYGLPF